MFGCLNIEEKSSLHPTCLRCSAVTIIGEIICATDFCSKGLRVYKACFWLSQVVRRSVLLISSCLPSRLVPLPWFLQTHLACRLCVPAPGRISALPEPAPELNLAQIQPAHRTDEKLSGRRPWSYQFFPSEIEIPPLFPQAFGSSRSDGTLSAPCDQVSKLSIYRPCGKTKSLCPDRAVGSGHRWRHR